MKKSDYSPPFCKGKEFIRIFFDSSIGFLLVSVGFFMLVGMFFMMVLSSCSPSKKKDLTPQEMAKECLLLFADKPESVKIIAVSEMDSVFGRCFFTNDELMRILDNVSAFNNEIFGKGSSIDFDDPAIESKIKRGALLTDIIQSNFGEPESSDEFSGWKLRVMYDCVDNFNISIKSERYFIFDKDMKYILHSFEIPIL